MAKVYLQIAIETEERPDRWACYSPEFGFTVYGRTREAARLEVNKALYALLSSFHGDWEAIGRFLEKRQVSHYYIQRDDQDSPTSVGAQLAWGQDGVDSHSKSSATEISFEEVLIAA